MPESSFWFCADLHDPYLMRAEGGQKVVLCMHGAVCLRKHTVIYELMKPRRNHPSSNNNIIKYK
jgi:hypothetical protein